MTSIYMMHENQMELNRNTRDALNQLRALFPACSYKALRRLVDKATEDAQAQAAALRAEYIETMGPEYGGCLRYELVSEYQVKGLTLRIDLTGAKVLYGEEFTKESARGTELWWRDADGKEYRQTA